MTFELDCSLRRRKQTHDETGSGSFSATAFANQAQSLTVAYQKIYSVNGAYWLACPEEAVFRSWKVHGKVLDLKQGRCRLALHTVSSVRARCTVSVRIH